MRPIAESKPTAALLRGMFAVLALAAIARFGFAWGEIDRTWLLDDLQSVREIELAENEVRMIRWWVREFTSLGETTSSSLTGLTCRFKVMPVTTTTLTINATTTNSATRTGMTYYTVGQTDFTTAGLFLGQLFLTDNATTLASPVFRVRVRPAVGAPNSKAGLLE